MIPVKDDLHKYNQHCCKNPKCIQAAANRHSDRTGCPYACRRRQSADRVFPHENHTGSKKADSGHNLCRDTGGIQCDTFISQNIRKPVLGYDHNQGSATRHYQVRANASLLIAAFPFIADDTSADSRKQDPNKKFHLCFKLHDVHHTIIFFLLYPSLYYTTPCVNRIC